MFCIYIQTDGHILALASVFAKYNYNDKVKEDEMARHVARMGEYKNAYRILEGKPEGKRPSGGPNHKLEDSIKMELRETGWVVGTGFIWIRIGTNGGLL
jgi:hypothetical protein